MNEVYDKQRVLAPARIFHDLNSLKAAPPKAARDFVVSHQRSGEFNLLPHGHKVRDKKGIPPMIVARSLASRQRTASASIMSSFSRSKFDLVSAESMTMSTPDHGRSSVRGKESFHD